MWRMPNKLDVALDVFLFFRLKSMSMDLMYATGMVIREADSDCNYPGETASLHMKTSKATL